MCRRKRVIRIFPNEASELRLIGAPLAEHHDVWQERKFLDMSAYQEWKEFTQIVGLDRLCTSCRGDQACIASLWLYSPYHY